MSSFAVVGHPSWLTPTDLRLLRLEGRGYGSGTLEIGSRKLMNERLTRYGWEAVLVRSLIPSYWEAAKALGRPLIVTDPSEDRACEVLRVTVHYRRVGEKRVRRRTL